jgi:serine/threonine protein kinase/Tfp pilus assembly protein PilF
MIGRTFAHYRIIEKLGEGGMGVVYLARDLELDRQVVLKFLPSFLASDKTFKDRFKREARAAASLNHPNIITIYEIGEFEKQAYIAMEYIHGGSLRDRISRAELSMRQILDYSLQLCDALSKAHDAGIVHRDIKSDNILIDDHDNIRIVDFGLAKLKNASRLTKTPSTMGTLSYSSPEHFKGQEVDHRGDIWSVGVVLYEMITGHMPFSGEYESALIYSVLNENPVPITRYKTDIPDGIPCIISRALNKDVSFRYQDIKDFLADLKRIDIEEKSKKPSKFQNAIFRIILLIIALTIISLVALFLPRWKSSIDINRELAGNTIVIEPFKRQGIAPEENQLTEKMLEYLIIDDLLQSTDMTVMTASEFGLLNRDVGMIPQLRIKGNLHISAFSNAIRIFIERPEGGTTDVYTTFADPVVLLTGKLTEITDEIMAVFGNPTRRKSTFTGRWDAFVRFFEGEQAWQRLEPNEAQHAFEAAIDIDPEFVLAKLRLAQVLNFSEKRVRAQELIREIEPFLGHLSYVDSLKARALEANLTGRLQDEITIRRKVNDRFPVRKDSPYELAEAYFTICDIKNAQRLYNKALELDEKFAKSHNHLAYCYTHLGQHKLALKHFRRYVELDSTANAFDSLSDGYLAAGKLDSAEWARNAGISIDSTLEYLYRSMCYIHIQQGRFKDAEKCIQKFQQRVVDKDRQARSHFLKGLVEYYRRNYAKALSFCLQSIETHDSRDIVTRDHEVHWLLGQLYLRLGEIQKAKNELAQMQRIVDEYDINANNYRRDIYKLRCHLKASIALHEGHLTEMYDCIAIFDAKIKFKIKDHNSSFDYAFFYNSFGEMFFEIGEWTNAEKYLNLALDYNPSYFYAHHNLYKLYRERNQPLKADKKLAAMNSLWADADPDVKKIYGL